ncbi:MAG: hypothetical protein QM731_02385 [Chitinophagaceae bacterium]
MNVEERSCLSCGRSVRGRIDKKFCDDGCRNTYNNQLNSDSNNFVRNVNNALRKNRRILQELLPVGTTTLNVSRKALAEKGFHFRFYTHTFVNQHKDCYYYCYDYGYRPLENDFVMVVKNNQNKL